MKNFLLYCGCITLFCLISGLYSAELKIEITKEAECTRKTKNGDSLHIHYKGTSEDGKEFDSSYKRGDPFTFTIGAGNVIKGWDQGLLDMCPGEKRRLTIPPELAYGDQGFAGLIKPKATIVFDTELIKIDAREEL